jgi:hypothetical protein
MLQAGRGWWGALRLVFSYREDEAAAYDRLVWQRRNGGLSYDNFMALIIAITFAIGFCVPFANGLGFVCDPTSRANFVAAMRDDASGARS